MPVTWRECASRAGEFICSPHMLQVYTHPIFYKHDTGIGHPENSARIDAAVEGVRRSGVSLINDPALHAETDRIIASAFRGLQPATR